MEEIIVINGVKYQRMDTVQSEQKPTGWERGNFDSSYYYITDNLRVDYDLDKDDGFDLSRYDAANYFSNMEIALNVSRAVKLFLRVNRFAAEHQTKKIDCVDVDQSKYYIYYNYQLCKFYVDVFFGGTNVRLFDVLFDSREAAEAAIEEFHDELIWYFTEFKNTLRF